MRSDDVGAWLGSALRAKDLLTCVDDYKRGALVEDIIEGWGSALVVEMLSSTSSAGRRVLLRPGATAPER